MSEESDPEDELGETAERMSGIADRFGTSDTTETTETTETNSDGPAASADMSETSETTETQPGDPDFDLREDWNGRTIYLPDDVVGDLDIRYQELNLQWQRENGEQLPKNERFYPAVVQAALNETSIEAELGLDD